MIIAIGGAGAFAREVSFVAEALGYDVDGFLCDITPIGTEILPGKAVLGRFTECKLRTAIAIGNPVIRERVAVHVPQHVTLIAPTVIARDVATTIGGGSIVCDGTILTTNIKIGRCCIINTGCSIGHDAVIENFCTLASNVSITGNCHIGRGCELGTGAILLPGVKLPPGGIIGAGSVVMKSPEVPSQAMSYTMVGCPARVIKVDGRRLP